MNDRATQKAKAPTVTSCATRHPTIPLRSVNFKSSVPGPEEGAISSSVVGHLSDAIAYLPTLGLVVIRKGKHESAHPTSTVARMVAMEPLLPADGDEV